MIDMKGVSKNILDYKTISYFSHKKIILCKPKNILLIEQFKNRTLRHLTILPFKCSEKDLKNKRTFFTKKKTYEPSYENFNFKTIKFIPLKKEIGLSLFSSKTSSPSNDQKILQNKSEKLHIYHRAASREVKNQDVISSWKSLDILLKQNNVRREEKMGRFYEKPTKKRSRLRSERHRKRFKKGIRYLVSIVKEMKRRGI